MLDFGLILECLMPTHLYGIQHDQIKLFVMSKDNRARMHPILNWNCSNFSHWFLQIASLTLVIGKNILYGRIW